MSDQHSDPTASPLQQAKSANQTAKQATAEAKLLRSLTPDEALERIEQTRSEQVAGEARKAERRLTNLSEFGGQQRKAPRHDTPIRGM